MPEPTASIAVVGAGDYIGSAIARRFALQGYHTFAGRRNGDKLAHLVIDSGVDTEWVRQRIAARGGSPDDRTLMSPASVAETCWRLHRQPRDAWTHELDLRPNTETW